LETGEDAGVALESCLATLRGLASAGPPRAFGAAAAAAPSLNQTLSASAPLSDTGSLGQTIPDPRAWTTLGTLNQATSVTNVRPEERWQVPTRYKAGSATVAFTVYRLNSVDSQDFYLVRGQWSLTPNFISTSSTCNADGRNWYYYNNMHQLGFSLQRVRGKGAGAEQGQIHSHAPQSVVRKKSYSFTLGAGLKAGGKVDKSGSGGSGEASLN